MATGQAAAAANRFGLGARAGELARIGQDPRGWLQAQLGAPPRIAAFDGLPGSRDYLTLYIQVQQQRRAARERMAAEGGASGAGASNDRPKRVGGRNELRKALLNELVLRQGVAVASSDSFRERLVRFWSNHFAISVDKRIASLFAAPMEREAIRPNATGRFGDLLLAVERHPGMLLYLDNARSVGAGSRQAQRAAQRTQARPNARRRGLNENLAREIMELHTLGVNAGYTQADVIEFAKAITGWSVARPHEAGGGNGFVFHAQAHEPGDRRVFGNIYRQAGEQQGIAILHALAVHPATAQHVSLKLARHFVADQPPPALVERMARTWVDTGGDLARVCNTMLGDELAWGEGCLKFKNPDDFCLSALRACGLDDKADLAMAMQMQGQLGQPVFQPRSPAGFGDVAADWGGPDALFKRVQAAQRLADRMQAGPEATPLALGQAALGPALDMQTATALRRAESVQQGVALLLGSPAFQWRT